MESCTNQSKDGACAASSSERPLSLTGSCRVVANQVPMPSVFDTEPAVCPNTETNVLMRDLQGYINTALSIKHPQQHCSRQDQWHCEKDLQKEGRLK